MYQNQLRVRDFILGSLASALLVGIAILLYLHLNKKTVVHTVNGGGDGPEFSMMSPTGFVIADSSNMDLLRKEGLSVNGVKWRFKNGNWERFNVSENNPEGIWIQDNSSKEYLLANFFEKIEVIQTEGVSPAAFQLISGNEALLSKNGMKITNGKLFRFVNNQWYENVNNKWVVSSNASDYASIMENYFVESYLLTSTVHHETGYVEGEGVRYRSVPTDYSANTILGYFTNYKEPQPLYSDEYSEFETVSFTNDKYSNATPDEVTILKFNGDWALVRIAKNGKIAWMKSQYFRAYECYGC